MHYYEDERAHVSTHKKKKKRKKKKKSKQRRKIEKVFRQSIVRSFESRVPPLPPSPPTRLLLMPQRQRHILLLPALHSPRSCQRPLSRPRPSRSLWQHRLRAERLASRRTHVANRVRHRRLHGGGGRAPQRPRVHGRRRRRRQGRGLSLCLDLRRDIADWRGRCARGVRGQWR